jgi:methylated-DNA-[protein]-cysteine S-methyltransferase
VSGPGLPALLATAFDTPFGELTVVVDEAAAGDRPGAGAVVAAGFTDLPALLERLAGRAAQRQASGPRREPARRFELVGPDELHGFAGDVPAMLGSWIDGAEPTSLDRVGVAQSGGPFVQRAWLAMRGIMPGQTCSYAQLAAAAGSPQAVRAAGAACATNLVAPFVPCHRVLRTGGGLGGYGYGLPVKRHLLAHEGVQL